MNSARGGNENGNGKEGKERQDDDYISPEAKKKRVKKWFLKKEYLDRGLDMFYKLNPQRMQTSVHVLNEMIMALVAIDKIATMEYTAMKTHKRSPVKAEWFRWAKNNYTFSDVSISLEERNLFSKSAQQFFSEDDNNTYIIDSLKFNFKGDSVLSPDEVLSNKIFYRQCGNAWQNALNEVNMTVMDAVARAQRERIKGTSAVNNSAQLAEIRDRVAFTLLQGLSIKKLQEWIEEDEDAAVEKEVADRKNQQKKLAYNYEQFVKKKDNLKIILPEETSKIKRPQSAPRMTFGKSVNPLRSKLIKVHTTTVDVMKDAGLRVVHALNRGEGSDLDKSRHVLVEGGYVDRRNFDDDEEGRRKFREALEKTKALNETVRSKKETSTMAFEDWSIVKDNHKTAIDYLKLITPPNPNVTNLGVGQEPPSATMTLLPTDSLNYACDVGKLLKLVDRNLFTAWFNWCNSHVYNKKKYNSATIKFIEKEKIMTNFLATTLWDSFVPVACDIHSAGSTQIRLILNKISKVEPSIDYAIRAYAKKKREMVGFEKFILSLSRQYSDDGEENSPREKLSLTNIFVNKDELTELFVDSGILVKPNEMEIVIKAFSTNSENTLSLKQLSDCLGDKKSDSLCRCCWLSTCPITGMSNAYTVNKGGGKQTSGNRSELAERRKREDILKRYSNLTPEEISSRFDSTKSKSCDYSMWNAEGSTLALKELSLLTKSERFEKAIVSAMTQGSPPAAPKIWAATTTSKPLNLCTSLEIHWTKSSQDELVSFYSLEYGGKVKMKQTGTSYKEIYRDPPSAFDSVQSYYVVDSLKPGTSYSFRIRAINGFGASVFAYRIFTTLPAQPTGLSITKLTNKSVTLIWGNYSCVSTMLTILKNIYDSLLAEGSNSTIQPQELKKRIMAISSQYPNVMQILQDISADLQLPHEETIDLFSLKVAADADTPITWEDLSRHIRRMNILNKYALRHISTNSKITYIVESCLRESSDEYMECGRTSDCSISIHRLQPGKTYRFRVYGLNVDNLDGPRSESVIVHTLLETLPTPTLKNSLTTAEVNQKIGSSIGIYPDKLELMWKGIVEFSANSQVLKNEWAKIDISDASVDLIKYFSLYDRIGNGTIHSLDLSNLLLDLGVSAETAEETLLELKQSCKFGFLSYADFLRWWNSIDTNFMLSRSDAMVPGSNKNGSEPAMKTKEYYGPGQSTTIQHLLPNRQYHFRLKQIQSKFQSVYSPPLVIMTACNRVDPPIVVHITWNSARVKWYSPSYGAAKYCVQFRPLNGAWNDAYIGPESFWVATTLAPQNRYEVRLVAINSQDVWSEPSASTQFTTAPRNMKIAYGSPAYQNSFHIECSKDICIGDTIMFFERVYKSHSNDFDYHIHHNQEEGGGGVENDANRENNHRPIRQDFIGDRAVIAHVIKDNLKNVHHSINLIENRRKLSKSRVLWLEVCWQRLTTKTCEFEEPKSNAVITRSQAKLEEYEVFRCQWIEEEKRKSFKDDMICQLESIVTS